MSSRSGLSRRRFLGDAGKVAATAGVLSALPPSIRRALAIPASSPTGTIADVEHVVILMQENRSFDHYFGALRGVRGFGDRHTIPLPDGRTVWDQSDGTRTVLPYHLDGSVGNAQRVPVTPHSWPDAQDAWDHGRMTSWPQFKLAHSMGYFTDAEVPYQTALADAFTVCDAYHCSIQSGTNPNRLFLWTGTHGPTPAGVASVVNEWWWLDTPETGYDWTTYPERLEDAGVSWKVYQNLPDNFGDNSLAGFVAFRAANAARGNGPDGAPFPPYSVDDDAVHPLLKGTSNTMPDGGFMEAFRADIAAGRLPQVSWIVAPEAYSEHPLPSTPVQGASYIENVVDSLTADPDVWARTVLIVNFDENDGYFDHVPPPAPPSIPDDPTTGASTCDASDEYFTHPEPPGTVDQPEPDGRPYGLGPRVPMLVISPWSRGGWVCSEVFDHTSVIRFLEARFGVAEPNISAWRRAVCGDLTSAFDFATPDGDPPPSLPTVGRRRADLERVAQERLDQVAIPDEGAQQRPLQQPGTRPSRPLPYELTITPAVAGGVLRLTLSNQGAAGAVIHAYDRLHLDRVPRRYTIEAGLAVEGSWDVAADGGRYDLWLLGPSGFHRTVVGTVDDAGGPEVVASHAAETSTLSLALSTSGGEPLTFRVRPTAYGGAAPEPVAVSGDAAVVVDWDAAETGGWYDLVVTVDEIAGFERSFAGRLENGRPSVSDPAFGVE